MASTSIKHVMVAPNVYIKVPEKKPAATKLGALAQQLVTQTQVATYSVAALSGYVYSLTQASSPEITFTDVPSNIPSSQLSTLQNAYSTFQTQYATFQGQASLWMNTSGTGGSSILSLLVSVPTMLSGISGIVNTYFGDLSALPPTSPIYKQTLNSLETLINAQSSSISSLNTQMQTLGSNLENMATSLVTSTQTGILQQLQAAYQADIQTLINDINTCTKQISTDNKNIIGEGFGSATSIAVGVVGLMNFWNPFGWVMIVAGAVGSYYAIDEIEALKGEISQLTNQINNDTNYENNDTLAAQTLAVFCNRLQGFSSMNNAAQQELTALETLYTTLSNNIATAVADLNNSDITDAQNEWNTILLEANFLANLNAYLWPSSTLLSAPSSFAAIGNDIYCIAISGEMYHYSSSSNSWTDMNVTALSCAGSGSTLVAIDGAPGDASAIGSTQNSTFFVKSYNISSQTWTTISDFPAACVAEGGGSIYAVNQTLNDWQVYQYSGSGTTWNKLTALPGPDAAIQIAVAGGTVFALTCNSQFVYQYNASNNSWTQIGNFTCASITANQNYLTLVGTNNNQYLYSTANGGAPTYTGYAVVQVAQDGSGDQYAVNTSQELWLTENTNPIKYLFLEYNITSVFISDTNQAYYVDNEGNMYSVTTTGSSTLLPALPTSGS